MHPVVSGNEFNDREASGLHPPQQGETAYPESKSHGLRKVTEH